MRLTIDENNTIVDIRGDRKNPMSRGYACFKGLQAEAAHHGPARLLHPLKRAADGSFHRIPLEQALDEIGREMELLIERDGPDSIGLFVGNGGIYDAALQCRPAEPERFVLQVSRAGIGAIGRAPGHARRAVPRE